jgi:mono/diheme cytochrome c family protein
MPVEAWGRMSAEEPMTHTRTAAMAGVIGLGTVTGLWGIEAVRGMKAQATTILVAQAPQPQARPPKAQDQGHAHGDHVHAPLPAAYANANIPIEVWTDPKMIAKGKEIYIAKCALCHGEKGDGKGPGAANLLLKPADLTDGKMVAEMAGNYWMWRVSEGGLVEPFKSKGSVMPAWKGELSMNERWAVIAYAHTFSGHRGPHVASEHPELKPKKVPKFVTGEGTVIALAPEKQQIVLEHGDIKDFMEPMTMGYKINPPSLLNSVTPGDKVRFTIDTTARAITKIDKLP